MTGKAKQAEKEVAGHIACEVKKQREINAYVYYALSPSFLCTLELNQLGFSPAICLVLDPG